MKPNIVQAGDRERAVNPEGDLSEVVYEYRDYRLGDLGRTVKDLLVGVEPGSGRILAVPPQSLLRLQHERRLKEKPLQARLPLAYRDVLDLISHTLGAPHPEKFAHAIVRFYLAEAQRDSAVSARLLRLSAFKPARGAKSVTFKVLVESRVWDWALGIAETSANTTQTDLVRSAILAAREDVLDSPKKRRRDQLAAIAQAV